MDVFSGRLQVYTGCGKGKTTAALGLAVRAACAGLPVYIGQFMKGGGYSELCLPERFPGLVTMEPYGTPGLLCRGERPRHEDLEAARRGLETLQAALHSGMYRVTVADELCVTVHLGLLPEAPVLELLDGRPGDVELILTGRYAGEGILERADLVTEMVEKRHYYRTEGLKARRGIEH